MSSIHDVGAMHKKFGFPVNEKPGILDDEFMQMRLNFILEEVMELADAAGFELFIDADEGTIPKFQRNKEAKPHLEDCLDALVDITVVTLGTADLMGFASHVPLSSSSKWSSIWWEAWSRVMQANIKKEKGKTSRGHEIDLVKPRGWEKPRFEDLLT